MAGRSGWTAAAQARGRLGTSVCLQHCAQIAQHCLAHFKARLDVMLCSQSARSWRGSIAAARIAAARLALQNYTLVCVIGLSLQGHSPAAVPAPFEQADLLKQGMPAEQGQWLADVEAMHQAFRQAGLRGLQAAAFGREGWAAQARQACCLAASA